MTCGPAAYAGRFQRGLLDECADELGEAGRVTPADPVASEQMAKLIDDLLRLARMSKAEVNLQPVDLGAEWPASPRNSSATARTGPSFSPSSSRSGCWPTAASSAPHYRT